MVCQECGLNTKLLGVHTPGCSQYEENEVTTLIESPEAQAASGPILSLVETAKDRTVLNMDSMINFHIREMGVEGTAIEALVKSQLRAELDSIKPMMEAAAFLGASNLFTVLIEQGILDEDRVLKFVADNTI